MDATPNAVIIESYLNGLHYPAKREDVLKSARQNHAPADVLEALGRLPADEFLSPDDIDDALRDSE